MTSNGSDVAGAANETRRAPDLVDVVVIGAGFAGLYAHYKFRELNLTTFGFEAAPEVGGTWFWNRYPGARCDVESLDYTYSFSPELLAEWQWSERFATQPEILRYVNHVADRFDLRRDYKFNTRVTAASYDEAANQWLVETDRGDKVRCRYLLCAVGCLSLPKAPEIEGLGDFSGRWVQTGAWPRDGVEFAGKRVAVIGTGSSGIQSIPIIAEAASHLTVFQRTPNYSVPAHNGPVDPEYEAQVRADYPAHCQSNRMTRGGVPQRLNTGLSAMEVSDAERRAKFEEAWAFGTFSLQAVFRDITSNPEFECRSRRVRARKNSQRRERSCHRGEADPARVSIRHQKAVPRHKLLRDLQSRQCRTRRYPGDADRAHHARRHPNDG